MATAGRRMAQDGCPGSPWTAAHRLQRTRSASRRGEGTDEEADAFPAALLSNEAT